MFKSRMNGIMRENKIRGRAPRVSYARLAKHVADAPKIARQLGS